MKLKNKPAMTFDEFKTMCFDLKDNKYYGKRTKEEWSEVLILKTYNKYFVF